MKALKMASAVTLVIAVTFVVAFNSAFAQQPSTQAPAEIRPDQSARPVAADAKSMIKQAYEITNNAKSVAEYDQIIDLLSTARQSTPTQASMDYSAKLLSWAYNRRGEAMADLAGDAADNGNTDGAADLDAKSLDDFNTAIRFDDTRWKAFHNRGVSLAVLGSYEDAIKDFNRAIQLNGKYTNSWFNRAELRYELGQFEGADEDYTQMIKLDPDDGGAYAGRAHVRYQLKRYNQAIEDFNAAVRLSPESALCYTDRADAFADLGRWDRAAADYRKAIELDLLFGRAYQGAAWLMATCPDDRFRNAELALQAAEKAIGLDGEADYRYLDTLAAAHANAGKFAEAEIALQRAIDTAPADFVDHLTQRMKLYQESRAFRQASRAEAAPR